MRCPRRIFRWNIFPSANVVPFARRRASEMNWCGVVSAEPFPSFASFVENELVRCLCDGIDFFVGVTRRNCHAVHERMLTVLVRDRGGGKMLAVSPRRCYLAARCGWRVVRRFNAREQGVERECSALFGLNIEIVFSHHVNLVVRRRQTRSTRLRFNNSPCHDQKSGCTGVDSSMSSMPV